MKIPKDTDWMRLPCGGVAFYDEPNYGVNYFCAQCECIVSDSTVPEQCRNEEKKWQLIKLLGGKGWDYFADLDDEY